MLQHAFYPDDVAALGIETFEGGLDFGGDFRRVRSSRTQHNLYARVNQIDCLEQVGQTLLPSDPAHEQKRRLRAVNAVLVENPPCRVVARRCCEVLNGDAVVHHAHLVLVYLGVCGEDVTFHAR